MKNLRLLSLVVAIILCIGCLTGCMGNIGTITINEDGSGVATIKSGLTKEGLESYNMEVDAIDYNSLEKFDYNGVTYYGEIKEIPFSSIEDFNQKVSTEIFELSEGAYIGLTKTYDNYFVLNFSVANTDTMQTEDLIQPSSPEEEAALQELLKSLAIVMEFNFPNEVTSNTPIINGITINGNKLTLDLIKMSESIKGTDLTGFEFISYAGNSVKENEPEIARLFFKDVDANMWYYTPIDVLANGGLIQGMGSGIFAPNDSLTYAQFCQILAKAKSLPVGEKNGYWAYTAIESCIKAGYVISVGDIVKENYDKPIPREAAIAAMYKSKANQLTVVVNNNVSIPDLNEFSVIYADDVINAYKYGITKGVDAYGTFLPKKSLTRAEVCQVFYNLNWTQPE